MEELVIGILHITGRVIAWFLLDIFFQVVCWGIGWATLKLVTLGRHPKKDMKEDSVAYVGFCMLLMVVVGFTIYVYFNST